MGCRRIGLIAPTLSDAREVMIGGPSGLARIGQEDERPRFESSRRRLVWPNGAEGYVFSAEDPDSLRGPQFDAAQAEADAEWRARSSISNPSPGGVVITASGDIPDGRWVEAQSLTVEMFGGALASDSHLRVLAGANRLAIRGANRWFTLQFRNAELVGERRYRLSGLLADGPTDFTDLPENSRCVVLDAIVSTLGMEAYERGQEMSFMALPSGVTSDAALHSSELAVYQGLDQQPLAPAHLKARRVTDGYEISWVRRARIGGDDWVSPDVPLNEDSERYQIAIRVAGEARHVFEVSQPAAQLLLTNLESWISSPLPEFDIVV